MGDERAQQASDELFKNTRVQDLFTLSQAGRNKITQNVSRWVLQGLLCVVASVR